MPPPQQTNNESAKDKAYNYLPDPPPSSHPGAIERHGSFSTGTTCDTGTGRKEEFERAKASEGGKLPYIKRGLEGDSGSILTREVE